jgi:hypothetical protein
MGYNNRHGFVSGLAAGGLFLFVLLVLFHGASRMVHGDPGALFVRPVGAHDIDADGRGG